jgi:hypothetical protein
MAVPIPVLPQDPKVVPITKYVYAAGVLAGTCYGSYKRITGNHNNGTKPEAAAPLKTRGAAA